MKDRNKQNSQPETAITTAGEAIAYLEAQGWSKTRLGLDRTRELLRRLGNPQKRLRFVHVAGSNGKGSTCAMLDAILRAAGYRTGLYTSPYLQEFGERIRVNGENIPDAALAELTRRVRAAAEAMDDHPSQFELVTALGMLYFARCGCEIVVLEVGMGGALDSTNAIDAPEAAVLTNIGLEHTEYLGNTLAEIAATKAGIVKPGCHAVCYDLPPEAFSAVAEACKRALVPLRRADGAFLTPLEQRLEGQRFAWKGTEYRLSLLGAHQLYNAAVALETVEVLRERGWTIPEEAVRTGLANVRWPARFEVLHRRPLFIADGGHNPQCAEALAGTAQSLLPEGRAVVLLGVLADKDYPRMAELLLPVASEFICLTPLSPRALAAEALAAHLRARGARACAAADVPAGIRAALSAAGEDGAVLACGSLYLVGAVRGEFPAVLRAWLRAQKIRAREALSAEERRERSELVCRKIAASEQYAGARTVLLYQAVGGELSLAALERMNAAAPAGEQKRFAYPLCLPDKKMQAVIPGDPDPKSGAWRTGAFGIPEPDIARGEIVPPEALDLVICPCTAFDDSGARLGMGGGYYDRFLPGCTHAFFAAAAFSAQRAAEIPAQPWDVRMGAVFTDGED